MTIIQTEDNTFFFKLRNSIIAGNKTVITKNKKRGGNLTNQTGKSKKTIKPIPRIIKKNQRTIFFCVLFFTFRLF